MAVQEDGVHAHAVDGRVLGVGVQNPGEKGAKLPGNRDRPAYLSFRYKDWRDKEIYKIRSILRLTWNPESGAEATEYEKPFSWKKHSGRMTFRYYREPVEALWQALKFERLGQFTYYRKHMTFVQLEAVTDEDTPESLRRKVELFQKRVEKRMKGINL